MSKTNTIACWFAAVSVFASPAHAQSMADTDWATNELSSELTECGQYFLVSRACFKDFPSPQTQSAATDYRAASDNISELALTVGKTVGIKAEAVAARMRLAHDALMKDINNNCTNVSILQERYATFCKELVQHPDQRFKELVQCSVDKTMLPCQDH